MKNIPLTKPISLLLISIVSLACSQNPQLTQTLAELQRERKVLEEAYQAQQQKIQQLQAQLDELKEKIELQAVPKLRMIHSLPTEKVRKKEKNSGFEEGTQQGLSAQLQSKQGEVKGQMAVQSVQNQQQEIENRPSQTKNQKNKLKNIKLDHTIVLGEQENEEEEQSFPERLNENTMPEKERQQISHQDIISSQASRKNNPLQDRKPADQSNTTTPLKEKQELLDQAFESSTLDKARLKAQKRNFDQALALYDQAIKENPSQEVSISLEKVDVYSINQPDKAITLLQSLLSQHAQSVNPPKIMLRIGELQIKNKQSAQAKATFQRLINIYPDSSFTQTAKNLINEIKP